MNRSVGVRMPGRRLLPIVASLRVACYLALAAAALQAGNPKPAGTASISGHVTIGATGQSLDKALIRVEGTNIEVLTNEYGDYVLSDLPAGPLTLRVSFTGQPSQTVDVKVDAGSSLVKDFVLGEKIASDGSVVMDTFKVQADRFKTGEEIATNEERYSPTIRNVVTSDSLGYVPDGNLGDFVKFLPGVTIGTGGDYTNPTSTSSVSVRGYDSYETAITIDGMPISSPQPGSLSRTVGLDMMSINNASRIEVIKVATPDMENNSAGGSINLISKSAFEFAKPRYSADLNFSANTRDAHFFRPMPGPNSNSIDHVQPCAHVTAIYPITKKLGVTVSVGVDNTFTPFNSLSSTWNNSAVTWSSAAVTNSVGPSAMNNPWLNKLQYINNPFANYRRSGNVKMDWRPVKGLTINGNVQYSTYTGINDKRRIDLTNGSPSDWNDTSSIGRFYSTTTSTNPGHKLAMNIDCRDKAGYTTTGYLQANYTMRKWVFNAKVSRSVGRSRFDDMANGHFSNIDVSVSGIGQVNFLGIQDGVPNQVTVLDRSGNQIDYSKLSTWKLDTIDAQSGLAMQQDLNDTAGLSVRRDFDLSWMSFDVKTGYDYRLKEQKKWGLGTGYKMKYVGPTLTPTSIMDTGYNQSPGYGMGSQEWVDPYKFYGLYAANPAYFDPNYNQTYQAGNYTSFINQNKLVRDRSDSFYGMIDARFFRNRLSVTTGLRKQEVNSSGFQPRRDTKYNYLRRPDGTLYTDSVYVNGVVINGDTVNCIDAATGSTYKCATDAFLSDSALVSRLKAAGVVTPDHVLWGENTVGTKGTNSNNLELSKRYQYEANFHKRLSNPATPMCAVTYRITQSLDLKLSWSRETTMPDLEGTDSTGTAGSLATNGNYTITDNPSPTGDLGSDGVIKCANPNLQPKVTNSYNATLSYYNKNGGKIEVSYYYKVTKNLWESVSIYKDSAEYDSILRGLGLDPTVYDNWTISTTTNGMSSAHTYGYEGEIRQNFGFLGAIGKHFTAFANYTHKDIDPVTFDTTILGQIQKKASDAYKGGLSFSANRFSASIRAIYTEVNTYGKAYTTYTFGGQKYAIYRLQPTSLRLSGQMSYRLSTHYSAFVSCQNINNYQSSYRVFDPVTKVIPSYAYYTSQSNSGIAFNFGIGGQW